MPENENKKKKRGGRGRGRGRGGQPGGGGGAGGGNKNNNNKSSLDVYHERAMAFHRYICQHDDARERASNRDGAHEVFVEFWKQQNPNRTIDKREERHSESMVMARLRQRRLLRSKRYDNNVLMVFADAQGKLPDVQERISIRDKVLQQKAVSQQDKYGVSVLVRPRDEAQMVDLNTTATCNLFIKLDANQFMALLPTDMAATTSSHAPEIQLESITLHGPHRQRYNLNVPFALPWSLTEDPAVRAVTTTVTPKHISVLRCSVQCNFTMTMMGDEEGGASSNSNNNKKNKKKKNTNNQTTNRISFHIARYLTTKGTLNSAMEQALQPRSEYQKKVIKKRDKIDVVLPPDDDDNKKKSSDNPLAKLPYAHIPKEIRDLLETRELERILEQPHVDDNHILQGYKTFWENLLWANEHQAHKDIQLFDMDQVPLQKEGRSYVLTVPGLAENRPSVLRGDMIRVIFPAKRMNMGRVSQVRLLTACLTLNKHFAKQYNPSVDKVDVQFSLSRTVFRTSHYGMAQAETHLQALMLQPSLTLYQARSPTPPRVERKHQFKWANRLLNKEQQAAVQQIVWGSARPMPYCIFGPPGTGKTSTIIEGTMTTCDTMAFFLVPKVSVLFLVADPCRVVVYTCVVLFSTGVYQLAKVVDKLLVVAPSNDAADILVDRVSSYFPPSELKRVLAFSRSIETVPAGIRHYVVELSEGDGGVGGTVGQASKHAKCDEIMRGRIVVTTVNLAARLSWMGIPRGHFNVLLVDEAGHATEPEVISVASTLMDFNPQTNSSNPGQLVLAGDPRQLGPVVTSELCRRFGLEVSYMERLMKTEVYGRRGGTKAQGVGGKEQGVFPGELVTKLVRNYRSHPAIIKLPNEMFYDGELEAKADFTVSHNLQNWEHLPAKGFPILFHGVDGENMREGNSPSWFNPQEVVQVVEYVKLLMRETRPALKHEDIGIITPYHQQAQKIRFALESEGLSSSRSEGSAGTMGRHGIKVGSVETFQGQERRCIIVSTVRADVEHVASDLKYNLGFVANEKRFNVTITRAKALLIVVGCPSVLALDKDNWFPFLSYCHEHKVRA